MRMLCSCIYAALAFASLADSALAHQQVHLEPGAAQQHDEVADRPRRRSFLQREEAAGGEVEKVATSFWKPFSQSQKNQCFVMFMAVCVMCCFGSAVQIMLQPLVGDKIAALVPISVNVGIWLYLMITGTFWAWLSGRHAVGFWCQWLCIWALMVSPCMCCLVLAAPAAYITMSAVMAEMKAKNAEKWKSLSTPWREFFESDAFRAKQDRTFKKADKDQSGSLDMEELKVLVEEMTARQHEELLRQTENDEARQAMKASSQFMAMTLTQMFQARSTCTKEEFVEMMRFVGVQAIEPGKCSTEQAFDILQLDQETATAQDFSKAKRAMSMKYHPDKRHGCDPQEAHKDQQDINIAANHLEKYFKTIRHFGQNYNIGDRVQAHSLSNSALLNGRTGKITALEDDPDNFRIVVDFGDAFGTKKLAPSNVQYPPSDEASECDISPVQQYVRVAP